MKRCARWLGAAGFAICFAVQGGCYERVVRDEGAGGQRVDVHEPNLKEDGGLVGGLEDLLLGEEDKGKQDGSAGRRRDR